MYANWMDDAVSRQPLHSALVGMAVEYGQITANVVRETAPRDDQLISLHWRHANVKSQPKTEAAHYLHNREVALLITAFWEGLKNKKSI